MSLLLFLPNQGLDRVHLVITRRGSVRLPKGPHPALAEAKQIGQARLAEIVICSRPALHRVSAKVAGKGLSAHSAPRVTE